MNQSHSLWLCLAIAANTSFAQTPIETRNIVKEAVTYGFPMLQNQGDAQRFLANKGQWNVIKHNDKLSAVKSHVIANPNIDYPTSDLFLDLRNEPVVITLPKTDSKNPISVQVYDWMGYQVANLGSLDQGQGGNFVIAGPEFSETLPPTATSIVKSNTSLARIQIRYQLANPDDKATLSKIQSGIKTQKFSVFAARKTIKTYGPLALNAVDLSKAPNSLGQLSENLTWANPSADKDLLAKYAKVNLGSGKKFDFNGIGADNQKSAQGAWDEALNEIRNSPKYSEIPAPLFGNREEIKNDYLKKARMNFWGGMVHTNKYALEIPMNTDGEGRALDAAAKRYTMKIKAEQFDQLQSNWSMTVLDQDHFVINGEKGAVKISKADLFKFNKDSKGDITLYFQFDKPVSDLAANWISVPEGNFSLIFRMYNPTSEAVKGEWTPPNLRSFPRD